MDAALPSRAHRSPLVAVRTLAARRLVLAITLAYGDDLGFYRCLSPKLRTAVPGSWSVAVAMRIATVFEAIVLCRALSRTGDTTFRAVSPV